MQVEQRHIDFAEDFGGTWLEGSVSAKTALIGKLVKWEAQHLARFEASLPPSAPVVPDDVRRLVIAARVFWDELSGPFPESDDLDKALEPFASRVPYADQPEVSHEA